MDRRRRRRRVGRHGVDGRRRRLVQPPRGEEDGHPAGFSGQILEFHKKLEFQMEFQKKLELAKKFKCFFWNFSWREGGAESLEKNWNSKK